jgi:hypothetical protein
VCKQSPTGGKKENRTVVILPTMHSPYETVSLHNDNQEVAGQKQKIKQKTNKK